MSPTKRPTQSKAACPKRPPATDLGHKPSKQDLDEPQSRAEPTKHVLRAQYTMRRTDRTLGTMRYGGWIAGTSMKRDNSDGVDTLLEIGRVMTRKPSPSNRIMPSENHTEYSRYLVSNQ